MKDGRPVSVRGSLEFTFNLYMDPVQQMDSSLRPTILYREKAQYTQEAKIMGSRHGSFKRRLQRRRSDRRHQSD